MRTRRVVLATSSLAALAGAVVAKRAVARRIRSWDANPDTTDGDPLGLPEGREHEIVAADGAVLRAAELGPGDGPTVLLVHCWTGFRGFWAPVARRLTDAGFRVIVVDQRGHGTSERGSAPYLPSTLGADVAAWLTELDLRDVVLAGHSMGGLASMACAIEHPDVVAERVKALALVATLASPSRDPRLPDMEVDLGRFIGVAQRALTPRDLGLLWMLGIFGTRPARVQLEAARTGFFTTDPIVRREAATMMSAFDLRPFLGSIAVPTRVIAGSTDRLTFVHTNQDIADRIPGATIDVLPGLGHMLPWEAPEQVTEHLIQAAKSDA